MPRLNSILMNDSSDCHTRIMPFTGPTTTSWRHMRIGECKSRSNLLVWCPTRNEDIERLNKNCEKCAWTGKNRKLSLVPSEFSSPLWKRVPMDLFFIHGRWWLVVTGYYSCYPKIARLDIITIECVILLCKSIFARLDIPDVVFPDNGPLFARIAGSAYSKFWETYGFRQFTSSPPRLGLGDICFSSPRSPQMARWADQWRAEWRSHIADSSRVPIVFPFPSISSPRSTLVPVTWKM